MQEKKLTNPLLYLLYVQLSKPLNSHNLNFWYTLSSLSDAKHLGLLCQIGQIPQKLDDSFILFYLFIFNGIKYIIIFKV